MFGVDMNDSTGKFINYYQLLEVDPKADAATVKQAYLTKIKQWHPDKNPDNREQAEEKTKVLNQAYHILGDTERRKHYDRMIRFTRGKNFDEYLNDEAVRSKLNKAYPYLKNVLEDVRELYALFKDSVRGNYKLHASNIAIIGGGLVYFVLPADLIPDFIPVIGYLDDLAVLTTIMVSLKDEIEEYRSWKKKKTDDPSNAP